MTGREAPRQAGEHTGVIQQITEGKLIIESVIEARQLLKVYPKDPALQRVYADLLLAEDRPQEAYRAYGEAAEGFIAAGMNLQAIVAKILQWSLQKPDHSQGRAFHTLLHEGGADANPLQRFFARLSYPELVAVMRRFVRVKLKAGQDVKKAGDPAKEVFFVVSGTLKESYPRSNRQASTLIAANDIFGDIFPLDRETASQATIKAVTDVELVKIAKPVLRTTCKKHPHIEQLLRQLHKAGRYPSRPWQTVRRNHRYGLPTKAVLYPAGFSGAPAKLHEAIALDLSLGGTCIELAPETNLPGNWPDMGNRVAIRLDLLNDTISLDVEGTVVWIRREGQQQEPALIGVKFDELETNDRELLEEYCLGSIGEQNLLWSLWESIIQPQSGASQSQ